MSTSTHHSLQRILSRSALPGIQHHTTSTAGSLIAQINAPAAMLTNSVPTSSHPAATNHPINPQEETHSTVNLSQILQELKALREEFKKGLAKVQEEQRKMGNALVKALEAAFTIEDSPYKEALNMEIAALYCSNLFRKPSAHDIAEKIVLVMGPLSQHDTKLAKAKAFCNKRLTDLRSEERRRVFGIKPCEHYVHLRTEEFAVKFLQGLKVNMDVKVIYVKNLALLRLYIRSYPDARNDTFKQFRRWLKTTFGDAPTAEDMDTIIQADVNFDYSSPQAVMNTRADTSSDFASITPSS